MIHALVTDGTIVRTGRVEQAGDLWQIIDGDTITGHPDPDEVAALGWLPVTDTPRPDDTADTTHDYSMQVVDGLPAVVWTPRPKTPEELADEAAAAKEQTLRQQAHDSLTALRTSIDTLKAITDKANADIGPRDTKDVARETRRVARQVLALTRLLLGALESSDTGTA